MSMFSVDINSANGANYIRPKKGASHKPAISLTPMTLTKNGSVFNDPNIFSADNNNPVLAPKTSRKGAPNQRGGNSIFNSKNMNFISGGNSGAGAPSGLNTLTGSIDPQLVSGGNNNGGDDDLGIGRDAGKGREAAKELKSATSDLKGDISDVENRGDQAATISKRGKKLQASIKKADDKFKEKEAQQTAQFKAMEQERRAVLMEMDAANKSIDEYSAELEAEIASGSGNFDKIASLRSSIREKNSTLTIGQSKVRIIGRSSKALVNEMNRNSKVYIKTNKAHQKDLDKNQEKLEKTLEVAADIMEISTIVEMTGSIIENLGKVFKACASIPYVGAALAAAGAVMEPIGATGKTVGQWGKIAAQVTQTVAYASAGMTEQAFMCAASALQSGVSAVGSTKEMASQWDNLGHELDEVNVDAAEAKATRAEAKADKAEAKATKLGEKEGVDQTKLDAANQKAQEARMEAGKQRIEATREQIDAMENDLNRYAKKLGVDANDPSLQQAQASISEMRGKLDGMTAVDENGNLVNTDAVMDKTRMEGLKNASAQLEAARDKANDLYTGKTTISDADKKVDTQNKKQVATKTKSTLKQIFSQEGFAMVGQALTLAGMICAMTESDNHDGKVKKHTDFQVSARAQKIVAQTMSKMGYSSPGMFQVRTR